MSFLLLVKTCHIITERVIVDGSRSFLEWADGTAADTSVSVGQTCGLGGCR